MTLQNRFLRLFKALTLCLLFASTPTLAQNNLLPADVSNFNIGTIGNGHSGNNLSNADVTTQYSYKKNENSLQSNETGPQCYAIGNNARWYNHQTNWTGIEQGFFEMGDHTTGTGNYMIVNGAASSNKKVWEYTVEVVPGVRYEFKAWVTCLFIRIATLPSLSSRPRLQLKINNSPVGDEFTVPWVDGGQWTQWSREWTAGNNTTSAKITIIDNCTERDGNDFGLDDIVFKRVDGYALAASNFTVTYCGEITPIELIEGTHYTMNDPTGGNSAPPMQVKIRKNSNHPWETSIITNHGTAYVGNDNKIYYTPNEGYYGSDDLRYQISRFGLVSEKRIDIIVRNVPSNCNPQGLPSDGLLCVDALSSFNPTASWASNGSNISQTFWEFKKDGATGWEPSESFQSYVQNNGGVGEYSIRFNAENECGTATPEVFQINVIDKPAIGSIGNIVPSSICAPATFSFELPNIDYHGSDPVVSPCWQMQVGGQWVNAPNTIEYEHNGCNIRYYAENGCGSSYSTSVPLTVNAAPIVGSITAPDGICEGGSFDLDVPQPIWRHNDLSTCWGSWEIQINDVWDSLVNHDVPLEYNGCLIRYKAVNGCGVPSYSTNTVQVTVYSTAPVDEGEIMACDAIYHHGQYCDETGVYVSNDSITPNGCQIQVSWHFTLGETYIGLPETLEACDFYRWPRTGETYYESTIVHDTVHSNDPHVCDSVFTLDLTINQAPTIQGTIQMEDICAGGLLEVSEPDYEYNHSEEGFHQWEYSTSPNGPFQAFAPETYPFEYGSYYIRFAVFNDCDSVFSNALVHVNDRPVINGQLAPLQVCEGNLLDLPELTVDWRNASQNGASEWQIADNQDGTFGQFDSSMPVQMEQNAHWLRFMARNECDTVYMGPVRITVLAEQEDWIDHEDCDSVMYDGAYYTESMTIEEVFNDPCRHTIHHNIMVNHSDYEEIERTTCNEYFDWHGYHFEHAEETQYGEFDTINSHGCDSIVILKLDFGPYEKINLDDVITCDSYVWDMNPGYVYSESQCDSVFVPASGPDDCPTWYYLNMTIGKSYVDLEGEPMTRCKGFEWHGVPCYADTIVYDSLRTKVAQCDSIVFYRLTIVDDYVNEFDTIACNPFEWYGFECNDYTNTMTIFHLFKSDQGCDSTVIKHVQLNKTETSTQFMARCDSYLCPYDSVLYDQPGIYFIYKDTILNQFGCDSIVHRIRLEVKDSEQMGLINGIPNVFVASGLVSGIYRYEINPEEVQGNIIWSLSNPDWQIVEARENYCLVFVATPGTATLSANFSTPQCGEIERSFDINAGFFGVGEHEAVTANIYPNPTNGLMTVEAEGIESIRLINMMGQVLDWREYDRSNTVDLDLSGFAPSVYLLEIKTINGMVKKRVMVSQ